MFISSVDARVVPLVLIIERWAAVHGIQDARTGTISSFPLVLLVLHSLQCEYTSMVSPVNLFLDMFSERFEDIFINFLPYFLHSLKITSSSD